MEIIVYIAVPVGAYARIGNIVPLVPLVSPVTLVPHKLKIDRPKFKIQIENQKKQNTKSNKSKNQNIKIKQNQKGLCGDYYVHTAFSS